MRWRVANLTSLQRRQLTLHTRCSLRVHANNVKRTHTFTVQPRILRKALTTSSNTYSPFLHLTHLAHKKRHPKLNKVPHRPGVLVQITTSKALVSAVKEHIVVLLQNDLRDHLPLFLRGVHARRVVRARMKQERGTLRRCPERINEPIKIQSNGLRIIVWIFHRFDPDVFKDRVVVGYVLISRQFTCPRKGKLTPGRITQINPRCPIPLVKPRQKQGSQMIGTCSRDSLDTDGPSFCKCNRARTQDQLCRGSYKFRKSSDREIFMIESFVIQKNLSNLFATFSYRVFEDEHC